MEKNLHNSQSKFCIFLHISTLTLLTLLNRKKNVNSFEKYEKKDATLAGHLVIIAAFVVMFHDCCELSSLWWKTQGAIMGCSPFWLQAQAPHDVVTLESIWNISKLPSLCVQKIWIFWEIIYFLNWFHEKKINLSKEKLFSRMF